MRNSEASRARAARILQGIRQALQAAPEPVTIDTAVEAALAMIHELAKPQTSRQVLDHVATFLQDLFARLPHAQRRLSAAQARDEAALLIGQCLAAGPGEGFDTAMLKLSDPSLPGMEVLYRRLGELLKERLQRTYAEWVFARHLDPSDGETNRAVAELLLDRLRPDMPDEAPALHPEAFIDCIPDLFFLVQKTEPSPNPGPGNQPPAGP